MAENEKKLEQRSSEIDRDYQKRLSNYQELTSQLTTPNIEPYAGLKSELQIMGSKVKKMKWEHSQYQKKRAAVEQALGGEKEIRSSHPGYEAAENLRDESSDIVERVTEIQDGYTKSAKRYNDLLQKGGIVSVKTADVINKFDSHQLGVQVQIQTFRNQLEEAKQLNLSAVTAESKQRAEILKQMSLKVDEIEVQNRVLFQIKGKIVKEAAGRAEFLTGPCLASYSFVEQINEISNIINAKGNELSELVDQFKKIPVQ